MRPPLSAGWMMSVVELARHRHPAAEQPHQDHQPARHEHDGAVITLKCEIGDQSDAGHRRGREGEPRGAGRDRRIESGEPRYRAKRKHPGQDAIGKMAGASD